jgi:N-acetyl sugar amidotransferase
MTARQKMNANYRICTQCVMDTTDSRITFDSAGICDHCRTFKETTEPAWCRERGDRGLIDRFVESVRREGRGKDFDCILGMSGGVDSSYLTYLATVQLGLRPLVFHVDAGWNSQESANNIEVLVDQLKLNLFTEVIDWEEMRDLQLSMFKAGVPHIDLPQDMAFFGTMYKFASSHNIKYILTGGNLSTECIRNPVEWVYYADSLQMKYIQKRFGSRILKTFPFSNVLKHKIYLPYFRGIRVHRPLNWIDYRKADAARFLQQQFGWLPYPQKHFESRFTRFYEGFWLPKRFGFDTRRVQLSSLILTNQMTREQAIEELQSPALSTQEARIECEFVAAKLDIAVDELMQYFDSPRKSYKDYPSMEMVFRLGAYAMKALGLEVGGKR